MNLLAQARLFAQKHKDVALVTVVSATGSTPRHAGTLMLVSASGESLGTVGGGRVEHEITQLARTLAGGAKCRRLKINLVQDVAMCCGGSMEFFVQPLAPSLELIGEASRRLDRRETVALETDLTSGAKQLVAAESEGRAFALEDKVFHQTLWPAPRLLLFGCGHLSRAIGPLARALDFEVLVCDDNETAALDSIPSWASSVVSSFELRDIERASGPLGGSDYLLVLTRDHGIDQRIVEACLPRVDEFAYLGLIGSLGKVGRFRKRILGKGLVTEAQWSALRAPMGLDICAETPHEIAVSIMGELVSLKNRKRRA